MTSRSVRPTPALDRPRAGRETQAAHLGRRTAPSGLRYIHRQPAVLAPKTPRCKPRSVRADHSSLPYSFRWGRYPAAGALDVPAQHGNGQRHEPRRNADSEHSAHRRHDVVDQNGSARYRGPRQVAPMAQPVIACRVELSQCGAARRAPVGPPGPYSHSSAAKRRAGWHPYAR